jgi:hypothetical protein
MRSTPGRILSDGWRIPYDRVFYKIRKIIRSRIVSGSIILTVSDIGRRPDAAPGMAPGRFSEKRMHLRFCCGIEELPKQYANSSV